MSGSHARPTVRRPPISSKQEETLLRMLGRAGQQGLDTLNYHGGEIVTDAAGAKRIEGLAGGWGNSASNCIQDLIDRNYRDPLPRNPTCDSSGPPVPVPGTVPGDTLGARRAADANRAARNGPSPAGDRFRASMSTTAQFTPTAEQDTVVEMFTTGESLKIYAGAGAGKTSTLRLCVQAAPDRRGLFVAFNKLIVQAADRSFPRRLPDGGGIECRTMHSLAWRATPKPYLVRMENSSRVHPDRIADILGIQSMALTVVNADGTRRPRMLAAGFLASLVMAAITKFCQSDDETPSRKHFGRVEGLDADDEWTNHNLVCDALEKHLAPVWDDLCTVDGWAPYKPDHYLKQWALQHPIIAQDYLLVDEAQDLSGVMRGFVKDQLDAGKQVVVVGDEWQSINEWMGAVNALASLPITNEARLTKSFRFGPAIAALANAILERLRTDFRIEGNEAVDSVVGAAPAEVRCTLARTNAVAVKGYMADLGAGGRPCLIGNTSDITWFCQYARVLQIAEERQSIEARLGLASLAADVRADLEAERDALNKEWAIEDLGSVRAHPELACFLTWEDVRLFVAEHEDGKDIKLMVKLVDDFGPMEIVRALKNMPTEDRATHLYSTAHKVKGREWNDVELAEDFAEDIDLVEPAELKLLYVAVTRGKVLVDPTRVGCLDGLWERAVAA